MFSCCQCALSFLVCMISKDRCEFLKFGTNVQFDSWTPLEHVLPTELTSSWVFDQFSLGFMVVKGHRDGNYCLAEAHDDREVILITLASMELTDFTELYDSKNEVYYKEAGSTWSSCFEKPPPKCTAICFRPAGCVNVCRI